MFWIGLLVGIALTLLVAWIKSKDIILKWYAWVIGMAGILSLFGAVQHYFGSMRENEPTSAWMGSLLFFILAVILLLVTWRLVDNHQKTA